MGTVTKAQKILMIDFVVLIILWFSKDPGFTKGWSSWFKEGEYITDGTVVLIAVIPLFILPKPLEELTDEERMKNKSVPFLDVETIKEAPWPTMLLLGGGFALAYGFKVSELSDCIAGSLNNLSSIPYGGVLIILCVTASFLGEFVSNVSAASIFVPIAASLCKELGIHPLAILISLTLSCSCSFMLPVSTPPNSIAYSTGYLTVGEMVKKGFMLKLIGLSLIILTFLAYGLPVYNVSNVHDVPEWAKNV